MGLVAAYAKRQGCQSAVRQIFANSTAKVGAVVCKAHDGCPAGNSAVSPVCSPTESPAVPPAHPREGLREGRDAVDCGSFVQSLGCMICASLQTFGVRCFYALRLTHGPRGRAGNEPRKGGRGLRSPLQVVCSIARITLPVAVSVYPQGIDVVNGDASDRPTCNSDSEGCCGQPA